MKVFIFIAFFVISVYGKVSRKFVYLFKTSCLCDKTIHDLDGKKMYVHVNLLAHAKFGQI